ncbi:hypothetical protein [Bradyrhizobium sp. RDM4]|uniref:hypothetical protein n=1 Tax=Bradyrhizobium sp. RDM4 TaxID=3378765 RepID=UPI0038FCEBF5
MANFKRSGLLHIAFKLIQAEGVRPLAAHRVTLRDMSTARGSPEFTISGQIDANDPRQTFGVEPTQPWCYFSTTSSLLGLVGRAMRLTHSRLPFWNWNTLAIRPRLRTHFKVGRAMPSVLPH